MIDVDRHTDPFPCAITDIEGMAHCIDAGAVRRIHGMQGFNGHLHPGGAGFGQKRVDRLLHHGMGSGEVL